MASPACAFIASSFLRQSVEGDVGVRPAVPYQDPGFCVHRQERIKTAAVACLGQALLAGTYGAKKRRRRARFNAVWHVKANGDPVREPFMRAGRGS